MLSDETSCGSLPVIIDRQRVAVDLQRHRDAHGIAAGLILVGIIGEEILAVGDVADDRARLVLGIVEQADEPGLEFVLAEAVDDLVHLALADIDTGDLGVEVAPILFGQADIVGDQAQQIVDS